MVDPSQVRQSWSWAYHNEEEQGDALANSRSNLSRRHSVTLASSKPVRSSLANRVIKLKERVATARDECLELRQEASDLQEYSNAKLGRVTRYLGVLADKARKLDEAALESEDRLAPLKKERKRLFNDILTLKGNVRVFVRVRPQFEHEGPTAISFPDDYIVRVSSVGTSPSKKEFEFDRVYGPHVGQASIFQDVQPLVQSALDGYNVCIFAYGQTGSGKTHTMEGPSHDRGLYFRAFEELFDLSITDTTSTAKYSFFLTMFELYNEQVRDLLSGTTTTKSAGTAKMGIVGVPVELSQQQVDNPADFARVFRAGNQCRITDGRTDRLCRSHLGITVHIHYTNVVSGVKQYSKLSMVDMAGSERLLEPEARGNRMTESLHVNKSLSAAGDVLSSVTSKKENHPYSNSRLTEMFSDSIGNDCKTLLIVHLSPSNVQETISSLSFASRARNVELSLGNRDSVKKWRDLANDARKELYEKEKMVAELQQEVLKLKKTIKDSDDQCLLLFNEVQKAWKVAFDLQADLGVQQAHITKLKNESSEYAEKYRLEKERNTHLNIQMAQLSRIEQDQKVELLDRGEQVQVLEAKVRELQEASRRSLDGVSSAAMSKSVKQELEKSRQESELARQKLEEELIKRDELIERLHQENEKLFERLTDKTLVPVSPKVDEVSSGRKDVDVQNPSDSFRSTSKSFEAAIAPSTPGAVALLKPVEKVKTTPAGEYLTAALEDFNPETYDGPAAIADGANKLLMLVLAAVIKAGAAREHEMLAEIRSAVFSFIRRIEPLRVMDTMLVSRVRILYIRSLLSRSSELQSIKMPPVDKFLEKAGASRSRGPSRGNSPARSPVRPELEDIPVFKVHLKPERKSKLSSMVLKLRGIEQETWKQQLTGSKLKEITDDARAYAIGNKKLAALFVHTPAGELQRQIRAWLAENFDFLSLTGGDNGSAGQLELLSTAVMDGWMSGLGIPSEGSTDALGQLLSDYTKRVYTTQLQHLKDVSATLATEEADDLVQVSKLRSALESVDHKRRRVLQQMRSDVALSAKETGSLPNPSTAAEDARMASLIALEEILKSIQAMESEVSQRGLTASRKRSMLTHISELSSRSVPALLSIDNVCAQKHMAGAKRMIETAEEQADNARSDDGLTAKEPSSPLSSELPDSDFGVQQWSVLQFNNGSSAPFVIKCGASPSLELVVKAQASLSDKSGKEVVASVPAPSTLSGLNLEEMKEVLSQLPEALCQLALARTADGTRARYARLFKTLAVRVPALRSSIHMQDSSANAAAPTSSSRQSLSSGSS